MDVLKLCFLVTFFLPIVKLQIENACKDVLCPFGSVCVQGGCLLLPTTVPIRVRDSTPCDSNPCLHDCECVSSCKHANGYYCRSPNGYIGKHCNIEVPRLNCSSDRITVSVSSALFADLYPSRPDGGCLFVGEKVGERGSGNDTCKVCFGASGYYTVTLFLPFTRCGGKVNNTGHSITFSNVLWAGLENVDAYDIPVPILHFQCIFQQEYRILTSLLPTLETWRIVVNDAMKLKAEVELCKIGNACPNKCPSLYSVRAGATYTISETIHAIMSIESSYFIDGGSALILQQLHLSCNSKYNDLTAADIVLVLGGCESGLLTTNINHLRSNQRVVCVSFKVPRLLQCRNSVFYIHAKLRVIKQENVPSCRSSKSLRAKRLRKKINIPLL